MATKSSPRRTCSAHAQAQAHAHAHAHAHAVGMRGSTFALCVQCACSVYVNVHAVHMQCTCGAHAVHKWCTCGSPRRTRTHHDNDDARVHLPLVEPLALGAVAVRLVHCAHHAATSGLEGAVLVRVGARARARVRARVRLRLRARVRLRARARVSPHLVLGLDEGVLDGHVRMRRRLTHRAATVRLKDSVGLCLLRARARVRVRVKDSLEDGVGLCLGAERRRHGNLGPGGRQHRMLPRGGLRG